MALNSSHKILRAGSVLLRYAIVLIIVAPMVLLFLSSIYYLLGAEHSIDWSELWTRIYARYVSSTLLVATGIACCTACIGVLTAWCVTQYEFIGRRWLEMALFLPLAVPAYIAAYVYGDIFDYAGPVQSWLREQFEWQKGDYWFPQFRSQAGAVMIISFVLYPYVYMLSRMAMLHMGELRVIAMSLGMAPSRLWFKVVLPFISPALIGGVLLVLMETLGEFGAMQFLAVDTFTTGIYRVWFSAHDRHTAMLLAVILCVVVLILVYIDSYSRRYKRYDIKQGEGQKRRYQPGIRGIMLMVSCAVPVILGAIIPVGYLFYMLQKVELNHTVELIAASVGNTLFVASIAALIMVVLGFFISYIQRHPHQFGVRIWEKKAWKLASLGYAIPGTVMAVAIMFAYGALDMRLNQWWGTGLLLSGTVFAVILAYVTRFLTISVQTIDTGVRQITPELEAVTHVMGKGAMWNMRRVHVKMVRRPIMVAAILVFVESVKELPATLIIRPFNFETLATRTYSFASDERLAESALPALLIIAISMVPLWFLFNERPAQGESSSS